MGQVNFTRKAMMKVQNNAENGNIRIPIILLLQQECDLILAPYRILANDGRPNPYFDAEDLQEIDTEAFCVRISRVKTIIEGVLREAIAFLKTDDGEDDVYLTREDGKVHVSAVLHAGAHMHPPKITLAMSLQISKLHLSGDLIFNSEYDLQDGTLVFHTDDSNFGADEDQIAGIFRECWSEIDHYVHIESHRE